jgi:hypothetical protein
MLKMECENGVVRVSDETIKAAIDEWTERFMDADIDMLEAFIDQFKVDLGKLRLEQAWTETCMKMAERELSERQTQTA